MATTMATTMAMRTIMATKTNNDYLICKYFKNICNKLSIYLLIYLFIQCVICNV